MPLPFRKPRPQRWGVLEQTKATSRQPGGVLRKQRAYLDREMVRGQTKIKESLPRPSKGLGPGRSELRDYYAARAYLTRGSRRSVCRLARLRCAKDNCVSTGSFGADCATPLPRPIRWFVAPTRHISRVI